MILIKLHNPKRGFTKIFTARLVNLSCKLSAGSVPDTLPPAIADVVAEAWELRLLCKDVCAGCLHS